ncbi:MAG: hypothetical protein ACLQUY_11070 [Ktedonobacterales bacterium]
MRLFGVKISPFITTLGLILLLATALIACSSSTGGVTSNSTASTGNRGGTGGAPGVLPPTATPTTSIASPGTGEGGIAEFCSGPADVESSLPASIPSYPNAEMRISKTSGGDGIFGLCTADSTNQVLDYYLAQLPSKGWQQISHNSIFSTEQIQATNGNGYVTITIEPDAQLANTTDIIIQTSGVS